MIKQILFDCGGVLAQMQLRDVMLKISGSEDVANYFIRNIWSKGSPWLRFDKGEISISEVVVELKKFMPEICPTYVEEIVNNWFDGLPIMDGMEEIVDALHEQGYPCYLLSNFDERFEELCERIPVLKKLDGVVVSYRVHMLKPDPAIYQHTAETFGFELEETLFVDDTIVNIESAKKIGLEGYLFTTPVAFCNYLKEQKILPSN